MKKLITLLLVLTGAVCTASATKIFFKPNSNWASSNAWFAVIQQQEDGNTDISWHKLSAIGDYHYADITIADNCGVIKIIRLNPEKTEPEWDGNWGGLKVPVPTKDTYYIQISEGWENWDNFNNVNVSYYLPCNYYFISNTGTSNAWVADDAFTESSGTYTYIFDGTTYAGKLIAFATGDAFDKDGNLTDWSKVFRPEDTDGGNHWLNFASYTYSQFYTNVTGDYKKVWYIPLAANSTQENPQITNEGTITITYNKAGNSGSITCTKSATIGADGYATYSNTEKFKVVGAEKIYTISEADSKATLNEQSSSTIFPAGTGIILKGSGSITIESVDADDTSAAIVGENLLIGSGNYTYNITGNTGSYDYTGYIFTNGANGVGFYKLDTTKGNTLDAHKAFLAVPTGVGGARSFIGFDFDVTGINQVMNNETQNGAIYNLQGVRMNKLQKGLNIVGGKKVLVK